MCCSELNWGKKKKGLLNQLGLTDHVVREEVENGSKYIHMKNCKKLMNQLELRQHETESHVTEEQFYHF